MYIHSIDKCSVFLFIYHKYPRLASQMNVKYEPCEENFETTYLNRADVQTAIHVQSTTWAACSNTIRYNQTDSDAPMNHYYKDLIAATGGTLHMTVLSGDDDSVCGTLGTTDWMYGLGLASKAPWTSWTDGRTSRWIYCTMATRIEFSDCTYCWT